MIRLFLYKTITSSTHILNPKELMLIVRDCSFAEIRHFSSRASKERVSISDTRNTQWHCAEVDGKIVGCGGVMLIGQTARLKAYFVDPEYRGTGIGVALTDRGIQFAIDRPEINTLEIFSVNPRCFEARGFTRIKDIREGITHLIRRT